MIEVFSGTATLTPVAKRHGMENSLALDKVGDKSETAAPEIRSDDFPMGLSGLSPNDRLRVDMANQLYFHACALYKHCTAKGILVTLENPSDSQFLAHGSLARCSQRDFTQLRRLSSLHVRRFVDASSC